MSCYVGSASHKAWHIASPPYMPAIITGTIVNGQQVTKVGVWGFLGKRLALEGSTQVPSSKGYVPLSPLSAASTIQSRHD